MSIIMNSVTQNYININEYCHGCLTKDRRLVPIDDNLHIFQKLMEDNIHRVDNLPTPQMCFECRARLHAADKFIQRAKKAQEFLKNAGKMVQLKSLSDLKITNNSQYVIEFNDIKIATDVIKTESTNEKIEEELGVDIKIEYTNDDELTYDSNPEEYSVKEESVNKEDKEVIKKKILRKITDKYEIVYLKRDLYKHRFVKEVQIDDEEAFYWLEERKKLKNYRCLEFKCDLCITGYSKKCKYSEHVNRFHLEKSGNFECNICKKRFNNRSKITSHLQDHYRKFVCLICNYENSIKMKVHTHIDYAHGRTVKCSLCGLNLEKLHDFYRHYNALHTHVICDYCGKKWSDRQRLIKHIRLHHYEHKCDICKKTYSTLDSLNRHNKCHHEVTRSEECYCVECDQQFENITRYNNHLKRSVKHKTVTGIPCPECNKVYQKRTYMNNHYKLVHLKKTSHYCEKCSRYFLNGFRLRQHITAIHDKIRPAKNKLCTICGRGFSTNKILENHIRTHTGERPFQCELCHSKFAQKTALVYHRRAIHKMPK